MALVVYAVTHAESKKDRIGRRCRWGPDKPDGYHVTEKAASEAVERWRARRPECRWRVARLAEV